MLHTNKVGRYFTKAKFETKDAPLQGDEEDGEDWSQNVATSDLQGRKKMIAMVNQETPITNFLIKGNMLNSV